MKHIELDFYLLVIIQEYWGNSRELAFRHNDSLLRSALMLGHTARHRRDYMDQLVVSGE